MDIWAVSTFSAVNKAAMSAGIQLSVRALHFSPFGCTPRSRISGLYGIFIFWGNHHIV